MRLKKLYGLGLAVALMAPVGVLTANPAGAAGGTTCSKQTGTATITPGLGATKKNQVIKATTNLSGCTGAVKTGVGTATINVPNANCGGLAMTGQTMKLSESIKWSNGKTSKLTGSSKTGPQVGQATITLKVTSGQFVNLHASTVVAFKIAQPAPYCTDAHPLKKLSIKGVKPFVVK